jgi:N-glycosylase/DNA lyase
MQTNDSILKEIFDRVALKNTLQGYTVRDIYEKMWFSVKYFMAKEEPPRIIIRNFGTFVPFPPLIAKQLKRVEDKINESEEKEELKSRKTYLEKAASCLEKDNASRKHRRPGDNSGEKGEV